jgi:hypothetical protein
MPRFRVIEDERKYLALRTELYLRIAAHLPPQIASEIMRNYGKLEALLHFEGVKQGLAISTLGLAGEMSDVEALAELDLLRPAEAIARIYGDADTPLVVAEAKWVAMMPGRGLEEEPWLSAAPVELPPMTLAEAHERYGPDLKVSAPAVRATRPAAETPVESAADYVPTPGDLRSAADALAESDDPLAMLERFAIPEHEDAVGESPEQIERIRDTLVRLTKDGGWKPADWQELIMRLHIEMQTDAWFLDVQLSTDVGRAMLAQCGMPDIHPGAGVMFGNDFRTTNEVP